jgi:hypothetical protein
MHDIEKGFRIDGRLIPWGTTMERAAALVGVDASSLPAIGYHALRAACHEGLGFRTLAAELSGNGASRPVTGTTWELAPLDDEVDDPAFWARQIEGHLGPPDQLSIQADAVGPNSVRHYTNWDRGDVAVGVSVYAALREVPEGLSAGMMWLSWSVEKAAEPFMAERRAACASLAVAAKEAEPFTVFNLALDLHPQGVGKGSRRESWLALHSPDILLTPPAVARRLDKRCFALWSNRRLKVHCLSTLWDSIIWDEGAKRKIAWWHTLPARGAGQSALHVGDWHVSDVTDSPGVAAAVEALERIPGVVLERWEGHDV